MNYDVSNPIFTDQVRELEVTDPCHADTFNRILSILVNNDVALNKKVEEDVKKELASVQADTINLAFQLAVQNLISTSGMKHIFIDKIESINDVNLLQGMYSNGKAYI